jgi:hypothetical protein
MSVAVDAGTSLILLPDASFTARGLTYPVSTCRDNDHMDSTPPYREICIAYRLREVLDRSISTKPRISGFSLLSRLIRLTLVVLLLVGASVASVIFSTSMPTHGRKPLVYQLSANKVRGADIIHVAHMEKGDAPDAQ